jgi:Cof subfamily protein (haloacid dehalogenase superfamily)
MPPKVVATDLDGTLLRSDGTLDERSRQALAAVEAAGSLVVICTARPTRWMRPLARATGHHGVAICANGGVVWDLHTESALEEFTLEPEVAREVVALLQAALPGGAWAVERATGFAREPAYQSRWPVPHDAVVDAIESLVSEPSLKLMLRHEPMSADALLQRARELVGNLAELSHSNSSDSLLEIAAAGVSKASSLARVCAERGIDRADVVAFGDMPNDLAMLEWAGHAVAVGNAHPDVIAAADEVTADNDDAGVARVLERLFADRALFARAWAGKASDIQSGG